MKILTAFCLLIVISLPVGAVEDQQVVYAGGTVPGLQAEVLGRLDTTSETTLSFEFPGNKLLIPYAKIESFRYSEKVARHLGVLPAIAVGLVRHRQQRHFFQITFRDESNSRHVAIFEVSKHMPQILLPILQTRAPSGYKLPNATKTNQKH